MPRDRVDELAQENARLRRLVSEHPAAQTLRWLAPFIREDLAAGRWEGEMPSAVERELRAAVTWLDRHESEAA